MSARRCRCTLPTEPIAVIHSDGGRELSCWLPGVMPDPSPLRARSSWLGKETRRYGELLWTALTDNGSGVEVRL